MNIFDVDRSGTIGTFGVRGSLLSFFPTDTPFQLRLQRIRGPLGVSMKRKSDATTANVQLPQIRQGVARVDSGLLPFLDTLSHAFLSNRVFRQFDVDRSGTIEARELSNALSQFGFQLSPRLIDLLQKKYSAYRSSLPSFAKLNKWGVD